MQGSQHHLEENPTDIRSVASALAARYGTYPDESAGPVIDQLVWFMLSARTTVEACDAAYRALRSAFPDWSSLAETPEEALYPLLRPIGLYRARARNLREATVRLRERFGAATLEALRSWPDADCEAFLLGLPGVGLKVARCVMCFGLARPVLAVDAHIWRVTRRLGWHDFPATDLRERAPTTFRHSCPRVSTSSPSTST